MAVEIDKNKCDGNGACAEACALKAIQVVNGKAVVSDECVECGSCITECPNQALSLPEQAK
jgi:NAD-dependent dihydropyrimidine dehydrogenase PreA subunit